MKLDLINSALKNEIKDNRQINLKVSKKDSRQKQTFWQKFKKVCNIK